MAHLLILLLAWSHKPAFHDKIKPMKSVFTPGVYQRGDDREVNLHITKKKAADKYEYGYTSECGIPDICGKEPK